MEPLDPMRGRNGAAFDPLGDDAVVIKETHLMRKPARGAVWVALASVLTMTVLSLIYWGNTFGLAPYLPASRVSVFHREEYWRLFTSIAVHADVQHLLSNGIVYGVLAFLLYGYYGPRVYPGLSLGLGGVITALAISTYPAQTLLVGASGVVYFMAAFWLTLFLWIERRLPWRKRLVRAVGFALIILVPTAIEPTVSYRTHAIGFAVGIAAGMAYFHRYKEKLRSSERYERPFLH